ncbi:aldo/keto reductase [Paenibacillus validus]|uniref:Aldo/keto reductase n=2 Tax=Paenibacillus validus TaxID=44253 RepID=A0A7X2ZA30_9BACL|nr:MULTISPECIES: aldo/keto reductase [Paenibacillus]MED4603360.1 aldo/keto reductase [Paenibacillus validus]MED4607951.1 aldo/keto reductase [Paenibacillus validus]MUG71128.1 aldo/keto reductase [Paenibacillus validus]
MTTLKQIHDATTLNNGVTMPWLGLGVWKTKDGDEVVQAVTDALAAGYRSIDTAASYGNEAGVGQALQASGIPREQLFVTTKVWNADQGFESTLRAFEESRRKLQLETIDLYLIHWPVKGKYKETWKALIKLRDEGYVRAIGVSNFQVHHLQDLIDDSGVVPAVNQVEFHPLLQQLELRRFCQKQRIQLEAWSPLMQGNLDLPLLTELAGKYGKSPAQIILRWDLQHGIVTIPKSVTKHRIQENADLFDFALTDEDMTRLDGLNQDRRFGPDPDNFDF